MTALLALMLLTPVHADDDGAVLIRLGGEVQATNDPVPLPRVKNAKRVNIDLVNADIRSVLRLIGEVAHLNFVMSDDVTGTVTVRLIDVPWDEALAAILGAKGLMAVPVGMDFYTIRALRGAGVVITP